MKATHYFDIDENLFGTFRGRNGIKLEHFCLQKNLREDLFISPVMKNRISCHLLNINIDLFHNKSNNYFQVNLHNV